MGTGVGVGLRRWHWGRGDAMEHVGCDGYGIEIDDVNIVEGRNIGNENFMIKSSLLLSKSFIVQLLGALQDWGKKIFQKNRMNLTGGNEYSKKK